MFSERDVFKVIPFKSKIKGKDFKEFDSGIYLIKCKLSRKIYIGSTSNFSNRFIEHRAMLRYDLHYNTH
jgi:hypothetical protein